MRRAGIGLFTSSWSACVFVMVMAALMVSAPLSASAAVTVEPDNWDYVDQTFDFKANGADKALPSAGAILCATDASDLIHKNGKDGAIDASSGAGKLIGKFLKRPIMANLIPDSDAKLFLATVISGVSQTVVGNLGGQSDMYTLNESGQALQDKVAATFDDNLFGSDDTGSIVTQAQSIAGLEPRAVTGAASYASQLAMDELDAATAVVMIWDYPELAVGTDEKSYADDELNAVVTIDADTDNVAESNFVGVEIPGETGPTFSTTDLNKKLRIQTVLDNTSLDLYNQGGGSLALYSGTTKNSLFGDDFEFRAEDTIAFNAVIDENAELDGEPDTYFGNGGTDTLDFVLGTKTFKSLKDAFGGSLTSTSQKIQSATALFQFDIMKADGTSMFADMSTGNVDISISRNTDLILEVTGTIKSDLLTFGENENFEVAFEIGDEFINNASRQELTTLDYDGSSTTAKLKVDTAAPAIVELDALADDSAAFDVINYNDDFELTALVYANGEKEFNPGKWLNVLALPVARQYNDLDTILQYSGQSWSSQTQIVSVSEGAEQSGEFFTSFTATLPSDVTFTAINAGMVLAVSDNARNPVIAYADSSNEAVFPLFGSGYVDSTTSFVTSDGDTVASATKAIDNEPAIFDTASFVVTGLPQGFNPAGVSGQFGLLQSATETENANVQLPGGSVVQVTRGTAQIAANVANVSGDNSQSGSPVMAVVKFQLSTTPQDPDVYLSAADIPDNFGFMMSSTQVDSWNTEDSFADLGWTLDTDNIVTDVANKVGYVTFTLGGQGLPAVENNISTEAILGIKVTDTDSGMNSIDPDGDSLGTSNGLIVDVTRPGVVPVPSVYSAADTLMGSLVIGSATAGAETQSSATDAIVAITDTKGRDKDDLVADYGDLDTIYLGELSKTGTVVETADTPFVNSVSTGTDLTGRDLSQTVQAGYMFVVSAKFAEEDFGASDEISFSAQNVSGGSTYFPYVLGDVGTNNFLDSSETEFGRAFRTVSADFTDFINNSANAAILPDVTSNGDGSAAGQVVAATWFLLLDGTNPDVREKNDAGEADFVRYVTLTARDLSGNVTEHGLRIGTASLIKAEPQIASFSLFNSIVKSKGYDKAYITGGTPSAFDIGAATVNNENTVDSGLELVVKIGDGTGGGGPLAGSNWVSLDLSELGGPILTEDDAAEITDENGTDLTTTPSTSTDSITYVTFNYSDFDDDTAVSSTSAKVVVGVTASNQVTNDVDSAKFYVDRDDPDPAANQSITESEDGMPSLDETGDGLARPGQGLEFTTTVTGDSFTTTDDDIDITANLYQFGLGMAVEPNVSISRSGQTYTASWSFEVSDDIANVSTSAKVIVDATDARDNVKSVQSNSIFIEKLGPTMNSMVLSVSNTVNYATDVVRVERNEWRAKDWQSDQQIATINDSGAVDYNDDWDWGGVDNEQFPVAPGDQLLVVAKFKVNDPSYKDLQSSAIRGDFSKFDSSLTHIEPNQGVSAAGGVVTATWEIEVKNNVDSAKSAKAVLSVTDPGGIKPAFDFNSPTLSVDTTKPDVDVTAKYFLEGQQVTELSKALVGDATASLHAEVNFEEGALDHPLKRYPTGLLKAVTDEYPSTGAAAFYQSLFTVDMSDFGTDVAINDFVKEVTWSFQGDGPNLIPNDLVTADFVTAASSKVVIDFVSNFKKIQEPGGAIAKDAAGNDLEFDYIPGFAFPEYTGGNKKAAGIVVKVSDHLGNQGSDSGTLQIDAKAPEIRNVEISVADGETYLPAIYDADDNILRVTQAPGGTLFNGTFEIKDTPVGTDPISVSVFGGDENAGLFTKFDGLSSSFTPATDFAVTSAHNAHFIVTPSEDGWADVSFAFKLDSDAQTFLMRNALINGNSVSTKAHKIAAASKVTVSASDTINGEILAAAYTNVNAGEDSRTSLAVDNQGPFVVDYSLSNVKPSDLGDVNGVVDMTNIERQLFNAMPGHYMVFAATVVIDGTQTVLDGDHFKNFNIAWEDALEKDGIDRLDSSDISSGLQLISDVTSVTSAIVLVTDAIKVHPDASPSDSFTVDITMNDFFGNTGTYETGGSVVDFKSTPGQVAINAVGPRATEITLVVDGKNEADPALNPSDLGIGRSVDSVSSSFEVGPGAGIVVAATITTVDGGLPEVIYADLSDLYPAGMAEAVSKVVPTTAFITPQGNAYAEWSQIAFNINTVTNPVGAFATNALADRQPDFASSNSVSEFWVDPVTATFSDGKYIDANGDWVANKLNKTKIANSDDKLSSGDMLKNLLGLPNIAVQRGETAKSVASITIEVEEPSSFFEAEEIASEIFTIDTQPPTAVFDFTVGSFYPPVPEGGLFDEDDVDINASFEDRIGFPKAPTLIGNRTNYPNRISGNSNADGSMANTLIVNVTIENPDLDADGDDAFIGVDSGNRYVFLSDDADLFNIEQAPAETAVPVTADLSSINENAHNAMAYFEAASGNVVEVSPRVDDESQITATFYVTVSPNVGITAVDTRTKEVNDEVSFTFWDDVKNNIEDNAFENNIDYVGVKGLAIDNVAPNISAKLDVILQSGSAKDTSGNVISAGQKVTGGYEILPDSVLAVTTTITDGVDHPLDVLKNQNFGFATLTPEGLDEAVVTPNYDKAKYIVPDSVLVPFTVEIPDISGDSTPGFQFIMRATDTVGNLREQLSSSTFRFDGKPIFVAFEQTEDGETAEITLPTADVLHAGVDSVIYSASAFDVGAVSTVEWLPMETINSDELMLSIVGGTETAPYIVKGDGEAEYLQADLQVTPQLVGYGSDLDNEMVTLKAVVTDDAPNSATSELLSLTINQPALFAEVFDVTKDSTVESATVEAEVAGMNAAGADVREVTVYEGDVLSVHVLADDANAADTVTLSASSTQFVTTTQTVESIAFGDAEAEDGIATVAGIDGSTVALEIVPGYLAVTGDNESATFTVDIAAADSAGHPSSDNTQILVNVMAKSAVPMIAVEEILEGTAAATVQDGTAVVYEGNTLTIVLKAEDAGNEALTFDYTASHEHIVSASEISTPADGILYATVTYTPGFKDADVIQGLEVPIDNPWDPFTFAFQASNSNETGTVEQGVNIENTSQAPLPTVAYSLNGAEFTAIEPGGMIENVEQGSTIVFDYTAEDPDGKLTYFPAANAVTIAPNIYTAQESGRNVSQPVASVSVTVKVPDVVEEDEATAVLTIKSVDLDGSETVSEFTIKVIPKVIPEDANISEVVFAAGLGGKTTVHVRNFDRANGNLFEIKDNFFGMPPNFLPVAGGGEGRDTNLSIGDIDNDGDDDIVVSFGPITSATVEDVTYPNVFMARDAKTGDVIKDSAVDPFIDVADDTKAAYYRGGEIITAVGDFIDSPTNQVVTAQGFGGNQVLRLWQWDGAGWAVKAQFNALEDDVNGAAANANVNNASGRVNLAVADFNNDGVDELLVGQGNSVTSETIVQLIQFSSTPNEFGLYDPESRIEFPAFAPSWRGEGGVRMVAADLNEDGTQELVVTSTGSPEDAKNVVSFLLPWFNAEGDVSGFTFAEGNYLLGDAIPTANNPSGVLNLAAGEFNGFADGDELVVATDSLLGEDGITAVQAAPNDIYGILKVDFDGTAIEGFWQAVTVDMGAYDANFGPFQTNKLSIFEDEFAPTSGQLNIATGDFLSAE